MELRDLPSVDELAREIDDPLAVDAARAVLARAREEIQPWRRSRRPLRAAPRRARRRTNAEPAPRPQRDGRRRAHEPRTRTARGGGARARQRGVRADTRTSSSTSTAGVRGSRQDHSARFSAALTGAESALVVDNNAAAVLLALAALAEGREVVVSRGELLEIGDGFRIPDVLARSGARLVEVGTTNRTRAADYERAIGPDTAPRPARAPVELPRRRLHRAAPSRRGRRGGAAARAAARRRPRLGRPRRHPRGAVGRRLARGRAPISCASPGDKLLGGPQAGIVAGRSDLVERLPPPSAAAGDARRQAHDRRARRNAPAPPRRARARSLCCACSPRTRRRRARAVRLAEMTAARRGDGRARRRRRAAADRAAELRVRGRRVARRTASRRRARR